MMPYTRQSTTSTERGESPTRDHPCRASRSPRAKRRLSTVALLSSLFCLLTSSAALGREPTPPVQPDEPRQQKDELGRRLIRRTAGGEDESLMNDVLRLMDDSGRRLEIEFDSGVETQAVQDRILDRLDEAIQAAAARRRMYRMKQQRPMSDKRRKAKGRPDAADTGQSRPDQESPPAPSTAAEATENVQSRRPTGGELLERRKAWGHLPMRQREEIIQGASESFLERYREWIERYYQSLQEAEE